MKIILIKTSWIVFKSFCDPAGLDSLMVIILSQNYRLILRTIDSIGPNFDAIIGTSMGNRLRDKRCYASEAFLGSYARLPCYKDCAILSYM